jgi:hypothetical protein
MFNKIAAAVTALVGMSSMLMGVAALPTGSGNATEIAARSIDPTGTHTGQVCGFTRLVMDIVLTGLIVDLLYARHLCLVEVFWSLTFRCS